MTDHVHAVPPTQPHQPGLCGWSWLWSGVLLRCTERAVPGSGYCTDHLIASYEEEETR